MTAPRTRAWSHGGNQVVSGFRSTFQKRHSLHLGLKSRRCTSRIGPWVGQCVTLAQSAKEVEDESTSTSDPDSVVLESRWPANGLKLALVAATMICTDVALRDPNILQLVGEGSTPLLANSLKHILDGLVAGGTGAAVVYPIDVIKTRLQMQENVASGISPKYTGPLDCAVKIVREEGIQGIYAGIIPQILGVAPEKGLKVTVFSTLQPILAATALGWHGWVWPCMFAAATAGGCQVLVTNPLEITKIRLQMQSVEGTKKPVLDIIRELGLGGLYQGAGVTASRDIPSVAVFFVVYELMKRVLSEGGTVALGPTQLLLAGFMAGVPSAASVTPIDVIKTRWQAKGGTQKYKSPIDCLERSVKEDGIMVLTTGWLPRVLRISPQLAVTLTVFEWLNP